MTSNIPKGLVNPSSILQSTRPLFSDLVSWGAREAISKCGDMSYMNSFVFRALTCSDIYNDRKKNLLQEKLIVPSRELREDADE